MVSKISGRGSRTTAIGQACQTTLISLTKLCLSDVILSIKTIKFVFNCRKMRLCFLIRLLMWHVVHHLVLPRVAIV